MEAFLEFAKGVGEYEFGYMYFIFNAILILLFISAILIFIYDKFIQREDQLLINYPLIGRARYLFYLLRDPMRQYFGDEKFYELFDKVKWVYDAAKHRNAYVSFSPSKSQKSARIALKNANIVLNSEEVDKEFSVVFGKGLSSPFVAKSIIGRSAMSDGALSPEATRAFSIAAYSEGFPINTGEGGLTSNYLTTHQYDTQSHSYMEVQKGTLFSVALYRVIRFFLNQSIARKIYCDVILNHKAKETFLFDEKSLVCFRVNWNAPLESFPKSVPCDVPDIVFQMGSGLYGVKDKKGKLDKERYKKVMCFCKMTEIKLAQGAKQTGGKLLASKVSESIAYYRSVEAHKELISPNRFPYANTLEELFDFIGELKALSGKPVGIKIVVSSKEGFGAYASLIKARIKKGSMGYPDFITIDGGDGGSATAPLEMMISIGMIVSKALYIADTALKKAGVRDKVKLIGSEKVLTPDDVVTLLAIGADFVNIARGFMLSAGCIRARVCSGANGRNCPVGLATQDRKKRASFLVEKRAKEIASYHNRLIEGARGLLAVMGIKGLSELNRKSLLFKDHTGKTYMNIDDYFKASIQSL